MQVEVVHGSSLTYCVQSLLEHQLDNTAVEGVKGILRFRSICKEGGKPDIQVEISHQVC